MPIFSVFIGLYRIFAKTRVLLLKTTLIHFFLDFLLNFKQTFLYKYSQIMYICAYLYIFSFIHLLVLCVSL